MSESVGAVDGLQSELPEMPELLDALLDADTPRIDPVQFHYLQSLAQRWEQAHGALREILEKKLRVALADYDAKFQQAEIESILPASHTPKPGAGLAALAELNRYIHAKTQATAMEEASGDGRSASEMKSVHQFKQAWSKINTEAKVAQALTQGPENAGPLNSHRLVLRTLALMRDLSPSYLQRFMSHMDTLLWLDKVNLKQAPAQAKPVKRVRVKK